MFDFLINFGLLVLLFGGLGLFFHWVGVGIHAPEWREEGRKDAKLPYYFHYDGAGPWQKYYDEGYYGKK